MFREIDTSRPWPKTGMTTEKWKQVPPFWVELDRLVATQDGIHLEPLRKIMLAMGRYPSHTGDVHPHVVSWNGKLYLEDGHHRAVVAQMNGKKELFARVLTVIDHGA